MSATNKEGSLSMCLPFKTHVTWSTPPHSSTHPRLPGDPRLNDGSKIFHRSWLKTHSATNRTHHSTVALWHLNIWQVSDHERIPLYMWFLADLCGFHLQFSISLQTTAGQRAFCLFENILGQQWKTVVRENLSKYSDLPGWHINPFSCSIWTVFTTSTCQVWIKQPVSASPKGNLIKVTTCKDSADWTFLSDRSSDVSCWLDWSRCKRQAGLLPTVGVIIWCHSARLMRNNNKKKIIRTTVLEFMLTGQSRPSVWNMWIKNQSIKKTKKTKQGPRGHSKGEGWLMTVYLFYYLILIIVILFLFFCFEWLFDKVIELNTSCGLIHHAQTKRLCRPFATFLFQLTRQIRRQQKHTAGKRRSSTRCTSQHVWISSLRGRLDAFLRARGKSGFSRAPGSARQWNSSSGEKQQKGPEFVS